MIESPLIRTLMAMYLAIWSPMLCCCAFKSTLSGGEPAGCCAISKKVESRVSSKSCCSVNETQPCDDDSAHEGNCQCHEKAIELTRFDSGVRIVLPDLAQWTLQAFLCDSGAVEEVVTCTVDWFSRVDLRPHPPPNSLFAQHSLLLN